MMSKQLKTATVFGTNRKQLLNQAVKNVGVITTLTHTSELVKLLRDGAYISRSRNINLDYAKVADEAADRITELEAQLADAKQDAERWKYSMQTNRFGIVNIYNIANGQNAPRTPKGITEFIDAAIAEGKQ